MRAEPTVHVVDDDAAVREALRRVIASLRVRVETHASAEQFLGAFDPARPGCLVLDVRLGGTNGLDLQEQLAASGAPIPVIIITAYGTVQTAVRAMRAGAVDVLEKPFDPRELRERVRQAVERDRSTRRQRAEKETLSAGVDLLTPREQEVLGLSLVGKTAKEIGEALNLSARTVEVHRARILTKTGASSVSELAKRLSPERSEP
jgi:RNA polymerase sigma factor (sigma-70 family)